MKENDKKHYLLSRKIEKNQNSCPENNLTCETKTVRSQNEAGPNLHITNNEKNIVPLFWEVKRSVGDSKGKIGSTNIRPKEW